MTIDSRKTLCLSLSRLCYHVVAALKSIKTDAEKEKYINSVAILHHCDNDSKNNPADGSNWMLVCRSCNHILNPRGKSKRSKSALRHKLHSVCVSERERERERERGRERAYEDTDVVKMSGELKKSNICVPKFESFLELLMRKFTVMVVEDFVNAASKELNLCQITVRRYLNRETNPINGKYEYFLTPDNERCIRLRSENP